MTTPAASRAATLPAEVREVLEQCRLWHNGASWRFSKDPQKVDAWKAQSDRIETALAALEAAQPASPAPLTDEQIDAIMAMVEDYGGARAETALFNARLRNSGRLAHPRFDAIRNTLAALASPQVAPAPKYIQRMDGQMVTGKDHFALQPAKAAAPVQVAPQDDARDAARYRFLRANDGLDQQIAGLNQCHWDAVVDAAMAAETSQGEQSHD